MKTLRHISLLILLLVVAGSCREDVTVTPLTFTRLLTGEISKTWVIKNLYLTEDGRITEELNLSSCLKDDRYTFYANPERAFVVTGGNLKCDIAEESVLISDSWSFVNANATLLVELPVLPFGQLPYIIRRLDKNHLVLEIFLDIDNRSSYRFNFDLVDEE